MVLFAFVLCTTVSCSTNKGAAYRLHKKSIFYKLNAEEKELGRSLRLPIKEYYHIDANVLRIGLLMPFKNKQSIYSNDIISGMKMMLEDRPEIQKDMQIQFVPIDIGTTITNMESAIEKFDQYPDINVIISSISNNQTRILYNALSSQGVTIFSPSYDPLLKGKQNIYMLGERWDDITRQLIRRWKQEECSSDKSDECSVYALLPDNEIGNIISSQCNKDNAIVFRYNSDKDTNLVLQSISRAIKEMEQYIKNKKLFCNNNVCNKVAILLKANGWRLRKIYHQIISSNVLNKYEIHFLSLASIDREAMDRMQNLFIVDNGSTKYQDNSNSENKTISNKPFAQQLYNIGYDLLPIIMNFLYYNNKLQKWEANNPAKNSILPVTLRGIGNKITITSDGAITRRIIVNRYNTRHKYE